MRDGSEEEPRFQFGTLDSTGNSPWDLNITLTDGSSFYKGGEDNSVIKVRLMP